MRREGPRSAQPASGPMLRPERWVPPLGLGFCLPADLQILC